MLTTAHHRLARATGWPSTGRQPPPIVFPSTTPPMNRSFHDVTLGCVRPAGKHAAFRQARRLRTPLLRDPTDPSRLRPLGHGATSTPATAAYPPGTCRRLFQSQPDGDKRAPPHITIRYGTAVVPIRFRQSAKGLARNRRAGHDGRGGGHDIDRARSRSGRPASAGGRRWRTGWMCGPGVRTTSWRPRCFIEPLRRGRL